MSHVRDVDAAACRLDGVTVRFGERAALENVTLRIQPGETVGLVGPSGAGKSTLLRTLAGLQEPTAGSVRVHGVDPMTVPTGPRRTALVGMLHQRLELVAQLSVRNNVQAGMLGRWSLVRSLAALLLPVEVPAARDAIERVGLTHLADVAAARVSGGELQRVALARLLVQEPRVLLADEPVSALDPARADDLLELMVDLTAEGRTLVLSLHTPEFARRHLGRIIGLRGGRVVFDRPAHEITDDLLADVYRLEETVRP